jgi:hypothetical protein
LSTAEASTPHIFDSISNIKATPVLDEPESQKRVEELKALHIAAEGNIQHLHKVLGLKRPIKHGIPHPKSWPSMRLFTGVRVYSMRSSGEQQNVKVTSLVSRILTQAASRKNGNSGLATV